MILKPPECAGDRLMPCKESDWEQCYRCHQLVCLVHDDLQEVWHSGTNSLRGTDKFCSTCIQSAYDCGEISNGPTWEWVNLR